jgi:hypothetical protein
MPETILYATDGPVATITLNRREQLNTIVPPLPDEVESAPGATACALRSASATGRSATTASRRRNAARTRTT